MRPSRNPASNQLQNFHSQSHNDITYINWTTFDESCFLFVVVLLGFILNISIILHLLTIRPSKKSITTLFTIHACILDSIKCIFCLPFALSLLYNHQPTHCSILAGSYVIVATSSGFNLLAMVCCEAYMFSERDVAAIKMAVKPCKSYNHTTYQQNLNRHYVSKYKQNSKNSHIHFVPNTKSSPSKSFSNIYQSNPNLSDPCVLKFHNTASQSSSSNLSSPNPYNHVESQQKRKPPKIVNKGSKNVYDGIDNEFKVANKPCHNHAKANQAQIIAVNPIFKNSFPKTRKYKTASSHVRKNNGEITEIKSAYFKKSFPDICTIDSKSFPSEKKSPKMPNFKVKAFHVKSASSRSTGFEDCTEYIPDSARASLYDRDDRKKKCLNNKAANSFCIKNNLPQKRKIAVNNNFRRKKKNKELKKVSNKLEMHYPQFKSNFIGTRKKLQNFHGTKQLLDFSGSKKNKNKKTNKLVTSNTRKKSPKNPTKPTKPNDQTKKSLFIFRKPKNQQTEIFPNIKPTNKINFSHNDTTAHSTASINKSNFSSNLVPANRSKETSGACVLFGVMMVHITSLVVHLGPTIIGGDFNYSNTIGNCLFAYGTVKSYVVQAMWVAIMTLALFASLFYLYKFYRQVTAKTGKRLSALVRSSVTASKHHIFNNDFCFNCESLNLRRLTLSRIRLLLFLILTFILCWYPLYTFTLLDTSFRSSVKLYKLMTFIAWANPTLNPLVFLLFDQELGLKSCINRKKVCACNFRCLKIFHNCCCRHHHHSPARLLITSEKTRPLVAKQVLMLMAAVEQKKSINAANNDKEHRNFSNKFSTFPRKTTNITKAFKMEKHQNTNNSQSIKSDEISADYILHKNSFEQAPSTLLSNRRMSLENISGLKIDPQLIYHELFRLNRVGRRLCVN